MATATVAIFFVLNELREQFAQPHYTIKVVMGGVGVFLGLIFSSKALGNGVYKFIAHFFGISLLI